MCINAGICVHLQTHTPPATGKLADCWVHCTMHIWKVKLIKLISVTPVFSDCSSQPHTHHYHSFKIKPTQSPLCCLHSHAPTNNRNTEPLWRSKYLILFVLTLGEALGSSATLLFHIAPLPPIVKLPPPVCFTIAHPLGEQQEGDWAHGAESCNFTEK